MNALVDALVNVIALVRLSLVVVLVLDLILVLPLTLLPLLLVLQELVEVFVMVLNSCTGECSIVRVRMQELASWVSRWMGPSTN